MSCLPLGPILSRDPPPRSLAEAPCRRQVGDTQDLGFLAFPTLGQTPTWSCESGRALQVREPAVQRHGASASGQPAPGLAGSGWPAPHVARAQPGSPGLSTAVPDGASPGGSVSDSSAESGSRAGTGRDCWDGASARCGAGGYVVYEGGGRGQAAEKGKADCSIPPHPRGPSSGGCLWR